MSITIIGLIITILGFLAKWFHWNLPGDEELQAFLTAVVSLGGIVVAWYGRVRKGDITIFGKRI